MRDGRCSAVLVCSGDFEPQQYHHSGSLLSSGIEGSESKEDRDSSGEFEPSISNDRGILWA